MTEDQAAAALALEQASEHARQLIGADKAASALLKLACSLLLADEPPRLPPDFYGANIVTLPTKPRH